MAFEFEIQNQKIKDWAVDAERTIKSTANAFNIQHRANSPSPSPSVNKIRSKLRLESSIVTAVVFTFPRSIIYPHTGSGRGKGGAKGSTWYTKSGIRKRTNPNSLGLANTGKRQAKPFINTALEIKVPILANVVAETSADIVTAKLFKQ